MAEVGLRWCGIDAAFNRTEDLDVKVSKEALSSAIRSGWCSKGPPTGHGRPQGPSLRHRTGVLGMTNRDFEARYYFRTSGHSPWSSGRQASSAGMVASC